VIRGELLSTKNCSSGLTALFRRDGHGGTVSKADDLSRTAIVQFYVSIIREATAKSKDGRIDQTDFLNYSAASSRYSLFTPMEASIIFHFAGRGSGAQRLALIDFAQLLDPRWRAPHEREEHKPAKASILRGLLHSTYNFMQGGTFVSVLTDDSPEIDGIRRYRRSIRRDHSVSN
jgi:solute carrier family 25 aspartate/glutamate transporter 12/13